jgi:flagellar basal-body rod modification protein FlgD
MSVASVTSTGAAATTTTAASKNLVDYNSFLKLLVAQAKNQDPTNPQDSTQYLAQLASFSAVEQSVQTNAKLDQILSMSRIADANSLIGRSVANADASITGVIGAVTIQGASVVATLTDGRQLEIGDGVSLGAGA